MPTRLFWISSAPNWVAHFHSNLDEPTILNAPKLVFIVASFIQRGLLGGLFVLFFFITTVTSYLFFTSLLERYLSPFFFVGLCALLGDVGVSCSAHLFYLSLVEALSEVLEVHSIEERSIGASAASASASAPTKV